MNIRKSFKLILLIVIFVILASMISGCKSGTDDSIEIDEFMQAYNTYSSYKYSGSILVAKGDRIIHNKGYEMSDYENNVMNTIETAFPIGSITKSFTATAILQLHERGKLNLEDTVSKFIEDNNRGDDVTIHQLLTHTAGIAREGKLSGSREITLDENVKFISNQRLLFEPGEDFSYSNAGYILLASIIEKVSGQSYSEYLEKNIFEPLSMKSTWCGNDSSYSENQALGYRRTTGDPSRLFIYNFSMIIGSGNIYSTSEDLYKYVQGLNDGILLSQESIEMMYTPHYGDSNNGYGYGWEVWKMNENRAVSHGGNIGGGGYSSYLLQYPDEDLIFVFLTNNDDTTALDAVSKSIEAIMFEDDYVIPEDSDSKKIEVELLKEYAGDYSFNNVLLSITYNDGKLYSTADDGNIYELLPLNESTFLYEDHQWIRGKFVNEDGDIKYILQNINNIFEFKKVK
ncbi:serine hydrolase domain-containing protein [Gudongella sp. DL1XJH-153]|uniref:serine hydrolase domain-containing protein n=1 Tax=Gudongella sp. DL1XJH-153 TaxID=3409804 RepID=UPI003BB4C658